MSTAKNEAQDFRFLADYHQVVPINEGDAIGRLNLSSANEAFAKLDHTDKDIFTAFIDNQFKTTDVKYLIGGYREDRNMYRRSNLFEQNLSISTLQFDEPRSLHLGTDIWGEAGTEIYSPLGGMVHSFQNNDNYGDYGPTIILQHHVGLITFYTLYGHLSSADLGAMRIGKFISRGECFAHFGKYEENGNWPPHLHFQIIVEIDNWEGDYPGVCKPSEAAKWIANSPDPDLILGLNTLII